ncbi:MAG TPA: hypothetical protein VE007_07655 [Thermoanaerobaculia bacterium]|nr:hypothetical protein [Thermoanaerobaculia bacterium]
MDSKRRTILCGLIFALAGGVVSAQNRTAATTIGITVERHSAVLLPADSSGIARLSTRPETAEGPAAIGNGSPALITVEDSRPLAPVSSGRARVAITVFEP